MEEITAWAMLVATSLLLAYAAVALAVCSGSCSAAWSAGAAGLGAAVAARGAVELLKWLVDPPEPD